MWGVSENFFVDKTGQSKEESGLSDTYYRLYGGGVGGPIWKNRTFFWAATEGYRSNTTRNEQQVWPSLKQRAGDFSTSTVGGVPVRIFNPYCRGGVATAKCPATGTGSLATGGEFTGAVIPRTHPAANPAGFGLLGAWPTQTIAGAIAGNENNEPNAAPPVRSSTRRTCSRSKASTSSATRWSMSGLYIYNKTDEPGSTIMRPEEWYIASQDNFFGPLRRRPHVAGAQQHQHPQRHDGADRCATASPRGRTPATSSRFRPGIGTLGFSSNYANAVAETDVFPNLLFDDVADVGGWGGEPGSLEQPLLVQRHAVEAVGQPQPQGRRRYAQAGRQAGDAKAQMGGTFTFDRLFTSNDGVGGHELASVLLARRHRDPVPFNRGNGDWFTTYYGAYVQDDWRVSQRLSVNYGVRFEHEDGLQEIENRQTVGFDQTAVSPLNATCPEDGSARRPDAQRRADLRRGRRRADRTGRSRRRSRSRRARGFSYSLNKATVVRGGYGLFYAPWNYSTTPARPDRVQPHDRDQSVGQHDQRAADVAREPVPGWVAAADWQFAWAC